MLTDGPVDMLVTIFQFMIKESDNSVFESALVALRSGIYLLHQSTEENHQNHLDNVLQKIACWVQKMCDFATDVNEWVLLKKIFSNFKFQKNDKDRLHVGAFPTGFFQ